MIVRNIFPIVVLLILAMPGQALEEKEILEIAGKAHDRKNLVPQLRLWTNMREFETTFTVTPREEKKAPIKGSFKGTFKTVDGKYLVTQFTIPKLETDDPEINDGITGKKLISIIGYDKEFDLYRKWILFDGAVMKGTGTSASGSRAVSWHMGPGILSVEEHNAGEIHWVQYSGAEGATFSIVGVTRKLK